MFQTLIAALQYLFQRKACQFSMKVVGPRIWNKIPNTIKYARTLSTLNICRATNGTWFYLGGGGGLNSSNIIEIAEYKNPFNILLCWFIYLFSGCRMAPTYIIYSMVYSLPHYLITSRGALQSITDSFLHPWAVYTLYYVI